MANPILMLLSGNGSLAGRDRAGAFTATGSGALRYAPANGARINHCINPRLANDAANWAANGGATVQRVADSSLGGYAYEASSSTATHGMNQANSNSGIDAASSVTISFDAYIVSGAGDWTITPSMRDAGNALISEAFTSAITVTSTPARYSATFTPSSYASNVHRISFKLLRTTSVASVVRVSNVLITNGSSTAFFDGSSTGCVWLDPITGVLGTANASPSVSRATFWIEEATTNTVPDPSFEAATITTNWSAAGAATISKVTTHAYIGSNGGKVSCTASTSDGIDQLSTGGAAASNGQAWTVSGRIRAFAAGDVGKTVKPQIVERTSADSVVATNLGSAITLTDAWQSFSYTVTLAGGGTVAKATCGFRAGAATAVDFVLDCVQLEQKAYATSYCDGTLGTGYSWSGTAHASTSSRAAAGVTIPSVSHVDTVKGAAVFRAYLTRHGGQRLVEVGAYSGGIAGDSITLLAGSSPAFQQLMGSGSTTGNSATQNGLTQGSLAHLYGEWTASTNGVAIEAVAVSSVARNRTPDGYPMGGAFPNISVGRGGAVAAAGETNIGPVVIYNRPLTAAERAKVNAAIDSNGAASLWTVLGSNANRNFQLRPISQ